MKLARALPLNDQSAWVRAIDEISAVDVRRMGENARRRYEQQFTCEQFSHEIRAEINRATNCIDDLTGR